MFDLPGKKAFAKFDGYNNALYFNVPNSIAIR